MTESVLNKMGLAQRIAAVLALDAGRGALEYRGHWHSWGDLTRAMTRIETLLARHNLDEGAPVGLLIRNRPGHVAAGLQLLCSRRCMVMINPLQPADKVAEDVRRLGIPVLIAEAEDCANPVIRAAADDSGTLLLESGAGGDPLAYEQHPPMRSPMHLTIEKRPGIAIRMLTSGTTGPAKRIDLPYSKFERTQLDALHYEGNAAWERVRLRETVVIVMTPLVHIGGIWTVVAAFLGGRPVALLDRFDLDEWRRVVMAYRPKVVAMPPAALRMICDAKVPREELSSIVAVRSGTSPLPPPLQEHFETHYGIPVLDSYGATEFAGTVAGWTLADHRQFAPLKRGSVGRAQPGCALRIIDQTTSEVLGTGQRGLLEVKPAGAGDWVRTNDIGEIDGEGFLFIRGRADDAIIRGGFKVSPGEVAQVLARHPAVRDAGVVGLPNARLGAVPVAAVELVPGGEAVTEDALISFARQHLLPYQIPIRIKIVEQLPRTPSMKISQPALRELFLDITEG